jgi:transcriptional regulator with XRE-family HTH domain
MSKEREQPSEPGEEERKALGTRLKEAREYLGFSQDDVAKYLGVPRTAISLMENGQRKVEVLELKKLAALYKKPVGYFTGEEEETETTFGSDVKHLARKVSELSEDDRKELGKFADFLRTRKKKKED